MGSIGGLTDAELLGLFATGGEAAELAFATLVARHGAMVLRVCWSILTDEHDAQDALQATFLVLVRRAGSVRNRESIASWLHGVALRVASCSRVSAARRRVHERRFAELATEEFHREDNDPDLSPVLHEELDRLPERFRSVITLCYLEGLACEAAAARLGLPVGTVKSRLARGRDRLRSRLTRRGLAPSAAALGTLLGAEQVPAALSPTIVDSTARIAMGVVAREAAGPGAVPASVIGTARRILMIMSLGRFLRSASLVFAVAASMAMASLVQRTPADPRPAKVPGARLAQPARPDGDPKRVQPEVVLQKALEAADQMPVGWMKAHALADIAADQARVGQADRSRETFKRASEIIERLHESTTAIRDFAFHRASNLAWLAKAQGSAGDRDGSRATIARALEWGSKIDKAGHRQTLFARGRAAGSGRRPGGSAPVRRRPGRRTGRHAGVCPRRDRRGSGQGRRPGRCPRDDDARRC
jgi:RNA polymerase sigma factor (sigma-70 family)